MWSPRSPAGDVAGHDNGPVTPRPPRLIHDRLTWVIYLVYGFYGALLSGLGPALNGLREDLRITHTEASLHSSLFAVGMLLAGLGGDIVIRAIGRKGTLWLASSGMTVGTLLFVLGPTLAVTLFAALFMGTTSSLLLVLVPAILSDHQGELRSAAFTELNSLASGMAVLVPVLIGLSIFGGFGWRPGLVLATILAVPVLAVWSRGLEIPEPRRVVRSIGGSLTPAYWAYWATLVLVVSVEFCMIYWTTDFFRTVFGLDPALAAGALTLFLLGMVVGRAAGGRIALRWSPTSIVPAALLLAGLGFAVFWLSPVAAVSLVAVFFTGLGVASLYPMTLGLAVGAALETTDLATSRAALASGSAVLAGPLLLAALADALGISVAFAIVPVLLALAWASLSVARRLSSAAVLGRVPSAGLDGR